MERTRPNDNKRARFIHTSDVAYGHAIRSNRVSVPEPVRRFREAVKAALLDRSPVPPSMSRDNFMVFRLPFLRRGMRQRDFYDVERFYLSLRGDFAVTSEEFTLVPER